jgi:pyruvate dehydrogenase E2 component (dihydrolipoamide acetyltransferase)
MTKVILPALGEGIEKATVSYWYVKEGDNIKEKDDLVEMTTDKATFNLPSPINGVLSEILVHEGDTVNIGEVVAIIEELK